MGCPLDFSPPEGFTDISEFRAVLPSRAASTPSPFPKNPKSSVSTTSAMVKQSCTSARSTSFGLMPAIL